MKKKLKEMEAELPKKEVEEDASLDDASPIAADGDIIPAENQDKVEKLSEGDDEDLKEGEDEDLKEGEDEDLKESDDEDEDDLKEGEDEDEKLKESELDKDDEDGKLKESEDEEDLEEEDEKDLEESEEDKEEEKKEIEEHVSALLKGKNLSESFKAKATTIFESAVKATADKRVSKIQAKYKAKVAALKEASDKKLAKKLDKYLDYVANEWLVENEIAIGSTLVEEETTKFLDGLKGLFENHYVEIPSAKRNLLDIQADTIRKLEESRSKEIAESARVRSELHSVRRAQVLEESSKDLSENQKEKFKTLVEKVEFVDSDTFAKKVSVIKEAYFSQASKPTAKHLHEGVVDQVGGFEKEVVVDAKVDAYAKAISDSVK